MLAPVEADSASLRRAMVHAGQSTVPRDRGFCPRCPWVRSAPRDGSTIGSGGFFPGSAWRPGTVLQSVPVVSLVLAGSQVLIAPGNTPCLHISPSPSPLRANMVNRTPACACVRRDIQRCRGRGFCPQCTWVRSAPGDGSVIGSGGFVGFGWFPREAWWFLGLYLYSRKCY